MFIEGVAGMQMVPTSAEKRKSTGSPLATGWAKSHLEREFGAGEGIRTLDPNLGKVVLYH
jgi:hypothetical protein